MRPVITISLNGNSYQLEQAGYESLRAYLATAEARLVDNPDKAEILADLEQAIAEKCGRFLSPHKNVVTAEEVEQVLRSAPPRRRDNPARSRRRARSRRTRRTVRGVQTVRTSACIRSGKAP